MDPATATATNTIIARLKTAITYGPLLGTVPLEDMSGTDYLSGWCVCIAPNPGEGYHHYYARTYQRNGQTPEEYYGREAIVWRGDLATADLRPLFERLVAHEDITREIISEYSERASGYDGVPKGYWTVDGLAALQSMVDVLADVEPPMWWDPADYLASDVLDPSEPDTDAEQIIAVAKTMDIWLDLAKTTSEVAAICGGQLWLQIADDAADIGILRYREDGSRVTTLGPWARGLWCDLCDLGVEYEHTHGIILSREDAASYQIEAATECPEAEY